MGIIGATGPPRTSGRMSRVEPCRGSRLTQEAEDCRAMRKIRAAGADVTTSTPLFAGVIGVGRTPGQIARSSLAGVAGHGLSRIVVAASARTPSGPCPR